MLTDIFEQIEKGGARSTKAGGILETGVPLLPKLPRDAGDRNRTSPFAFTGNKFEFRAVSANQSIAWPNIVLTVAVTESLDHIATALEKRVAAGKRLEDAVAELLPRLVADHKRIIFNGNGYSDAWQKEAARRGLLNLRNTVDALPELVKPAAVEAFERYGVLNEREMHARYEVNLEAYCKTVNIEAQLMVLMANRYILPASVRYQTTLAESAAALRAAGARSRGTVKTLKTVAKAIDELRDRADALERLLLAPNGGSVEKHARHFRDKVVPAMVRLRETGDALEVMVASDLWPFPTYREMLFVK
jgi:glutamine synthetase